MPQGKLAGCTVLQIDVTLNYTTHYLSWDMLPSFISSLTRAISTTVRYCAVQIQQHRLITCLAPTAQLSCILFK